MIDDRCLDLRECIVNVTTVTTVLRHASLVAGDLQGLSEPIEAVAREGERIKKRVIFKYRRTCGSEKEPCANRPCRRVKMFT